MGRGAGNLTETLTWSLLRGTFCLFGPKQSKDELNGFPCRPVLTRTLKLEHARALLSFSREMLQHSLSQGFAVSFPRTPSAPSNSVSALHWLPVSLIPRFAAEISPVVGSLGERGAHRVKMQKPRAQGCPWLTSPEVQAKLRSHFLAGTSPGGSDQDLPTWVRILWLYTNPAQGLVYKETQVRC